MRPPPSPRATVGAEAKVYFTCKVPGDGVFYEQGTSVNRYIGPCCGPRRGAVSDNRSAISGQCTLEIYGEVDHTKWIALNALKTPLNPASPLRRQGEDPEEESVQPYLQPYFILGIRVEWISVFCQPVPSPSGSGGTTLQGYLTHKTTHPPRTLL